jgi:hypothetical protein
MVAIAADALIDFVGSRLSHGSVTASRRAELGPADLITGFRLPGSGCLALVVQLEWKPVVAFALSFRREQDAVVARLAVGAGLGRVILFAVCRVWGRGVVCIIVPPRSKHTPEKSNLLLRLGRRDGVDAARPR